MEPLTFTCPSCGLPLRYDYDEAGDPYECPGCGGRGTLPAMQLLPLEDERRQEPDEHDLAPPTLEGGENPPAPARPAELQVIREEAERREKKRKRRRAWRPVHRGLTLLLFSWLAVTVLATILLLGLMYRWLQVLFPLEGKSVSKEAAGVMGILFVLADSVALYGYRQCVKAPKGEGVRDWAWLSLGLAAVRNVACLTTSIVYLVVSLESFKVLGIFTIVAAGLFFGQWFVCTLLLRAVADALKSHWLIRMAWNNVFLLSAAVLGWLATLCGYFVVAGGSEEGFRELGLVEGAWLQIMVSCGGAALTVVLWLAVLWHLRLLNYLRGAVEA
jgi:hypothetical protein